MRRATVLAALAGVLVGSVVTASIAIVKGADPNGPRRPSASDSAAPVTAPVTRQVVVDSEVIAGSLGWADVEEKIADGGVVTAMPVADGAQLTPGKVAIDVNGMPILALHMDFGLWRDLTLGDSGADVAQLHTALAETGTYPGPADAPVTAQTFAALAKLDPRLAADPLPAGAVVPVDASGSTLGARGITVGSRLGERTVTVRRHSDSLAVDDGGLAAEYAAAGQGITLYGSDGKVAWEGRVADVTTESSRTLLTLAGGGTLPAKVASAAVILSQTAGPVLAAPRTAITPRADGTSVVRVVAADAAGPTETVVDVGLCNADLCEITPRDNDGAAPIHDGTLIVVR